MTDAIVTDLTEYRQRKQDEEYFAEWTDRHIWTRQNLLFLMRRDGIDGHEKAFAFAFRNGYDPEAHPEDNLARVQAEATRRGVELTSA